MKILFVLLPERKKDVPITTKVAYDELLPNSFQFLCLKRRNDIPTTRLMVRFQLH